MKIGVVCPYSWDMPGGVSGAHQRPCRGVASAEVTRCRSWLPADDDTPVPPYVVSAGRAVPIHYNGSVARLTFGPLSASRVRRWLADGRFDVLHVHEPASPSLGLLAVWWADMPVVATFHQAPPRSRAMSAAFGILQSGIEKISARIAVSEEARTVVVQHLGGDPIVIPNGLYVDRFAAGVARRSGRAARAPCRSWAASTSRARAACPARGMADHLPRTARCTAAGGRPRRRRRNPAHDSGRLSRRGHLPRRGERRGQDRHVRIERRLRRPAYGERVVRDRSRRGDGRWNAGPRERTGRLSNGCGGRSPWRTRARGRCSGVGEGRPRAARGPGSAGGAEIARIAVRATTGRPSRTRCSRSTRWRSPPEPGTCAVATASPGIGSRRGMARAGHDDRAPARVVPVVDGQSAGPAALASGQVPCRTRRRAPAPVRSGARSGWWRLARSGQLGPGRGRRIARQNGRGDRPRTSRK